MTLDRCQWKMVDSKDFVLGQSADRCGEVAAVKILRPHRKNDLFLCENHLNHFIKHWGLHNDVEILCHNWMEGFNGPVDWNKANGLDWEDLDPPPAKVVADPALITEIIYRGSPLPKRRHRNCVDPGCKKCLPDDPKTWRHR